MYKGEIKFLQSWQHENMGIAMLYITPFLGHVLP